MTASALSRPGERERVSTKLGQIDWRLTAVVLLAIPVVSLVLRPLMLARMTIDEQGITRAGRGG